MEAVRRLRSTGDVLLALSLTLLVQAEVWLSPGPDPDEIPLTVTLGGSLGAAVAALIFTVSLIWRRRIPLISLLLAYPALGLAGTASLDAAISLTFAVMVATYSAGAHTRGRAAVVAATGVAGLVALTVLRASVGVEEPGDIVLPLSLLGGPWLAGLAIRERRDREAMLEERAAILERERGEQARTAIAEERARIAREMHDIVAHAMSVVVLQARGAKRTLSNDPGATTAALDAIESTSSGALAEMRQLLGVLRADDPAPRMPEPTLVALDALVEQLRETGLRVDVDIAGPPIDLPPGLDRAAYRILQEALTNVVRHGGATSATVSIAYRPDLLELTVRDAGTSDVARAEVVDGRGIAGMRERAVSLGGTLDAGPDVGGGFSVRAWLPLSGASS
jgi:signal transduction histidine kinase